MTDREIFDLLVIHRQKRKSVSFKFNEKGEIHCFVPLKFSDAEILELVRKHRRALSNRFENAKERNNLPSLTENDLRLLAEKALDVIPPLVKRFAKEMGVTYGRITIRNQKTRWGSCSSKGNLNFNCCLMLLDESLIEYVVVHELAHRKEMNHSPAFWAEVEKILPDFSERRKRLRSVVIPGFESA